MKIVKDFIKEKLVEVGFNVRNLFDFEQMDKSQLEKNTDSAEFTQGKTTLNRKVEGESVENEVEQATLTRKISENVCNLGLRLLMKKETIDFRLDQFKAAIHTGHNNDVIARIEKDNDDSYYEITRLEHNNGQEIKLGVIEVIMTLTVRSSIKKETINPTIADFPFTGQIYD